MQRALLPVAALALIAIGLLRHRPWPSLVAAWAIPTAACAALFAILTGAKPLTLLASTALAPLLALDATSSTSRVVGRVEACLRRPGPDDGERLGREVTTIKAAFGNAITRTLIVAVAANMGIALGALIGTVWLAVRVW
jgi:pheromone shutdown protein TraB